jgi:hypothetical protein
MADVLDINLESQLVNNYVQNHKEKIKILHETINKNLTERKIKTITKHNETREDIPEIPDTVYVKSNFRSKGRNKYKKETVISKDVTKKTIQPEIESGKKGRKFHKLHMDNIKRPCKTDIPLLQNDHTPLA